MTEVQKEIARGIAIIESRKLLTNVQLLKIKKKFEELKREAEPVKV